jgi:hypothetical protein
MAAMCAAAMGCVAWARGEGWVNVVLNTGGGALTAAHKGQSMVRLEASPPSAPCTTIFIMPLLEHTISMPLGLTTGEAMATPTDNANHTSTKRVMWMAWRRRFMALILSTALAKSDLGKRLTYLNLL